MNPTPGKTSVLDASAGRRDAPWGLALHGGAGAIRREMLSPEREAEYRHGLERALRAGYDVLRKGGPALDTVEASVRVLEDNPLFNAGKGSVFTNDGSQELEASIMDGRSLRAGAVAGLRRVKNPVSLARLVMETSPHVMLIGDGAESFARQHGAEMVDPGYFRTERRWRQLEERLAAEAPDGAGPSRESESEGGGLGTVGCVALDPAGNLAAGTSTGGMTSKLPGRVGDSALIGAGTFADNRTCAVSATGAGEYFIRATVAHEISSLLAHRGLALKQAVQRVVGCDLAALGGTGGVIAIDARGVPVMEFNTEGMYRGRIDFDGRMDVAIFDD